jgi:hypothetical protein
MPVDFRIGDVVRLRKPHPCGSYEWTVVRIGADIGLRCLRCNRRVLLDRSEVERRTRAFVSRAPRPDPFGDAQALETLASPPAERE